METPEIGLVRGFLDKKGAKAWITGGTVRDLVLGKQPYDIDLVSEDDPEPLAREFADDIEGSYFYLSEEFHTHRVLGCGRVGVYDFSLQRGSSIEADLGHRDFTINAMAAALPGDGSVIDPLGGLADLKKNRIAAVGDYIFEQDPLRLLRAPRLEKQLGFQLDSELARLVRDKAPLIARSAAERILYEITRLLEAPDAPRAVRRLDELGLLNILLPELVALKGVGQNDYHHLDVFEHTLANCEALDRIIEEPGAFFPERAEQIKERSGRWIAGDATWRFVMSFASLMHDVAKPRCRFIDEDGQVRFFEHDKQGAEMAAAIMARFRASSDATEAVSFLVRKHMRFEGLIQEPVPTPRARMRYLRATEPFSPEAIMLSVSDRLSVRGPLVTEEDVERHLALAREMMDAAFAQEEAEPLPKLISGDDLIKEFGLKPSPLIGWLLDRVYEEQRLGNVGSRQEALAAAGGFLEEELPPTTNERGFEG